MKYLLTSPQNIQNILILLSTGKTVTMKKQIAVLTGAGISTSIGIPDFRGPTGVWTQHPDQMKVYDIDIFLSNTADREYSWQWQKQSPVWNAQPGIGHKALVKLEKAGLHTKYDYLASRLIHEPIEKALPIRVDETISAQALS